MTKKPLILCVDDEWNGLEGRKMLLEGRGYQVLAATNGAEALQLFASHRVDLVLLDYHMLGMNGDVIAATRYRRLALPSRGPPRSHFEDRGRATRRWTTLGLLNPTVAEEKEALHDPAYQ